MSTTIVFTLRYARADNEALLNEKAYILNYTTPPEIPRSNFTIDFFPGIKIHNLRTANLNFRDNGLSIAKLPRSMPKQDFDDEEKIEKDYLPDIHSCIRQTLGAKEVFIFDYMVRKREPLFPYQPKTKDNAPQPALSAHIDYTEDEIKGRLHKYFKDRAEEFGKRWFQIVNVWKPLEGPLRDYPMAYCDAKTLNPETDLLAVDEVFPKVANEVYQVLHNPKHKWYYIPDQLDSEVAIFAGYDSRQGQRLSVPHCSFDLGDPSSTGPRQSIEVRAFVFYEE
ncbi:7 alpha-cephem-methoxylase protein [Rutstroemia sp. NJR-2017a WRK4]|nr:7 alpha-cephem-methoxylase protein [Rutstroemia sp. NJR-2017a WRK4]